MATLNTTLSVRAEADRMASDETPDVRLFLGMTAVIASARMRAVMQFVERIAQSNAAVLITGESGSGKELIARALHEYSPRNGRPWIDINCAALPDHLLESELGGWLFRIQQEDSPPRNIYQIVI